jgi:MFS family permease
MNKIVKNLLAAESVWQFGSGMFLPIFAIFSEKVGGDILDAGIAAALFLLTTSALQLPLGIWLDKVKEKWFLVSCYFMTSAVFLGYAFVQNKWELFGLQIIFGLAIAVGDTAYDSMYDRNTEESRSGKFWSLLHACIGFASALGIIIGAAIVHFYGFGVVFVAGSVFAFIAGTVAAIFLENSNI